jgi:hypothetical protein
MAVPHTLKDPLSVQQTLANGPVFMSKVAGMNMLTFTQIVPRADETVIGGASNPAHDTVVVCRVAMTDRILAELISTLQQAAIAAQPAAGNA